jgi:hypothetical protein
MFRLADIAGDIRSVRVTWAGLGAGDVGRRVEIQDCKSLMVMAHGRFSGGAAVVLDGGEGGKPREIAHRTTDGETVVARPPRFLQPRVIGGDRDTSLTVRIVARRGGR